MKLSTTSQERTAPLDPAQEAYLQAQMNKVSRSFALVVAALEQPLRTYLSTAYMLCRVADNIEDCTQTSDWKDGRYAEFRSMLDDPAAASGVLASWEAASWLGLKPDETLLMGAASGSELWRIYAQTPDEERAIIGRWTSTMVDGMSRLGRPGQAPLFLDRHGVKILARESDYDQYCFIVAGTVGHMATELVISHYSLDAELAHRLSEGSEACGRALQKTNILKDFAEDLARGVSYLPDKWLQEVGYSPLSLEGAPAAWKRMVIENILTELATSTAYVLALPAEVAGYRMASLLCLLPALQTNLLAAREHEKLFTPEHRLKISRLTLGMCMFDARRMVGNNDQIQAYSRKTQSEIQTILQAAQAGA